MRKMTEQEARKEAWRIARADLEEANDFYEIPKDDAYEIEPLVSEYRGVRHALEDLIESLQGYGSDKATALINLEEKIQNAVSDIKDELVRQEQLRREYPELYELD